MFIIGNIVDRISQELEAGFCQHRSQCPGINIDQDDHRQAPSSPNESNAETLVSEVCAFNGRFLFLQFY